ncbi:MAG: DUF3820 family protein [Dehalococcoidia bacterium]
MNEFPLPDSEVLLRLVETRMPYGKYAGRCLPDLPEPYLAWFAKKGFPEGDLGEMLQLVYEIKANGLEYLLKPLR